MSEHVINDYVEETTGQEDAYPAEVVQAVLRQHGNSSHRIKIAPPPRYTGAAADVSLDTWIFRTFEYLGDHANTSEGIRTAASYLDGNAAIWWQSIAISARALGQEPFDIWDEFAEALREYLCPGFTVAENALRRLLNHRQNNMSVSDYVSEFTNLRTRSGIRDEATVQHLFINGLEPVVQFEVTKSQPNNVAAAIHLAMRYEIMVNRLGQQRPSRPLPIPPPRYQPPPRPQPQRPPQQQLPRPLPPLPVRANGPVPMELDNIQMPLPLTAAERTRLRDIGGCFRCRQVGHTKWNCPMNQGNGPRQ